jgi:hypothetical protein
MKTQAAARFIHSWARRRDLLRAVALAEILSACACVATGSSEASSAGQRTPVNEDPGTASITFTSTVRTMPLHVASALQALAARPNAHFTYLDRSHKCLGRCKRSVTRRSSVQRKPALRAMLSQSMSHRSRQDRWRLAFLPLARSLARPAHARAR